MKLNHKAFGGAILAAAPLLLSYGTNKATWWAGFVFTVLGPLLLGVERKK